MGMVAEVRPGVPRGGRRGPQLRGGCRDRRGPGRARAFDSVGAFEPPMPWLGFRRPGRATTGPAAGPRWPRTRRGGRAVLQPDGQPLGLATGYRRGQGRPPGRRAGPGGRLGQLPGRPTVRRHGPGRAGGLRHGRPGQCAPTTATAWPGWAPTCRGPRCSRLGAHHGAHLSHPDHFAAFAPRSWRAGSPKSGRTAAGRCRAAGVGRAMPKCRTRRERSSSYSAPSPPPSRRSPGGSGRGTAPTNMTRSESASSGPQGPEVRRLSP